MPSSKSTPKKKTTVEAITHEDTRVNIPTADSVSLVSDSIKAPIQLKYPRDPSLDPQLVWKGKDEQDSEDLAVEAPPIFIQEKVDPRVLIENLRVKPLAESDPELSLFDDFDGLEGMETVEYYQHDANWSNRIILGDSLQVMSSLAERENLRGQVQMIYIDPPYGIKFGSNWQVRASKREVRDNVDDASREVEQVKAFRDTWELGIHSYLTYLRDRLIVSRDMLTMSGSVFLQIGDENVHLVRLLMDEVFGAENFVAQITVRKTMSSSTEGIGRVCDYLIWYSKEKPSMKTRKLYIQQTLGGEAMSTYKTLEFSDGTTRPLTQAELSGLDPLPEKSRVYGSAPLTSARPAGAGDLYEYEYEGLIYTPGKGTWKTDKRGMDRLAAARRILSSGNRLYYKRYLDDFGLFPIANVWSDMLSWAMPDKVYVVQTRREIIDRCMLMTTDPGDLVIDPTCGGGTTATAAELWGRRWITIDSSRVAVTLARQRLMNLALPYFKLRDNGVTGFQSVRNGFEYAEVPHVMLSSISNNPDIRADMSPEELRTAITLGSEKEFLYDKPVVDASKIRVSGPFTVESLSPHRAIVEDSVTPQSELQAIFDPSQKSFESMLLENLVTSGVQNGRKSERFEFESFQPAAGQFISAELFAKSNHVNNGRIAVSIGPRYGTVGVDLIKEAAREAVRGQGFSTLLVLGFAFDPQALEAVSEFAPADMNGYEVGEAKSIGNLNILLVRMNADLAMGEKLLKKSKAANLFTIFGEPDVGVPQKSVDGWTLEINGFDVYNPITGDVRSGSATDIAMWMIDTNYNGESFFVRHAYFPGGDDPYKKLKAALKADIDEDAWASLNSTTSRSFPTPTTGKIAVKIINDYGDEVMKVIEISE
jgi:adenine-specific DNA-methyltransferase